MSEAVKGELIECGFMLLGVVAVVGMAALIILFDDIRRALKAKFKRV